MERISPHIPNALSRDDHPLELDVGWLKLPRDNFDGLRCDPDLPLFERGGVVGGGDILGLDLSDPVTETVKAIGWADRRNI